MRGLISIVSGFMLLGLTAPALAQASKVATKVGEHGFWGTYAYTANKSKVCYVLTVAQEAEPKSLDHGDIFFTISQKPDKNISYEPQFITSYEMQEGSKVIVTVGAEILQHVHQRQIRLGRERRRRAAAYRSHEGWLDMKVAAKSKRGNPTSYVFSLKGISAALDSIASCK